MDDAEASGVMTLAQLASMHQSLDDEPISPAAKEKPFLCSICRRRFTHRANLINHEARHSIPRDYRCSICGKAFRQKVSVRVHERIHSPNSHYFCSICGTSSSTKGNLKSHLLTHTGQRPFQCSICGKAFTQKHTLLTHNRVHSGSRPFKCEFCDKAFISRSKLKIHRVVHDRQPSECGVCRKQFTTLPRLNRHMASMHGMEPLATDRELGPMDCQLCKKSFTTPGRLTRHMVNIHHSNRVESAVSSTATTPYVRTSLDVDGARGESEARGSTSDQQQSTGRKAGVVDEIGTSTPEPQCVD